MTEIKYLLDLKAMQLNCTRAVRFNSVKLYSDGTYRYILFALKNLFNQSINKISFSLIQYDKDNRVLKRELVTIDKYNFKKKKNISYDKLTKVHVNTDHVDFEVVHIDFITITYDQGNVYYIDEKGKKLPNINSKTIKTNRSYYLNQLKTGLIIGCFLIFMVSIILILAVIFDHVAFDAILEQF